jgi:two-component system, NarL family, sensor histidine kinase DesK
VRPADRAVVVPALIAVTVFKLVLLGFPISSLVSASRSPAWWSGVLALVVVAAGQVLVTSAVLLGRNRTPRAAAAAVLEFAATLPPLFLLGEDWTAMPTLGLADVLLCTVGWVRVAIVGIGALPYLAGHLRYFSGVQLVEQIGEALLSVTIFYAVLRMATLVRELAVARIELARLAVGQERLRMARDLHDTLGRTLTVGLFKLEVAHRLSAGESARVRRELDEASDLLRDAMAAVQDVVTGARDTSLRSELAGAVSVLRSAGIEVTADIDPIVLARSAEEALGWVMREAATNVLRHSTASVCTIALDHRGGAAELAVTNDEPSPPGQRWTGPSGKEGIVGMRQRIEAVGGELEVESDENRFRVVARVPKEDT